MTKQQCITKIAEQFSQVLEYSGRFLLQIGQYQDCLDSPNLTYNLVSFSFPGQPPSFPMTLGLCLPKVCTTEQISQAMNYVLNQTGNKLQLYRINNNVPAYSYQYNWGFYLFIAISVFMSIMVVISTVVSFLGKSSKVTSLFSIQESLKIFKRTESNLNLFNGIRSLSMIWVVIGHIFSFIVLYTNALTSFEQNAMLKPYYLFIQAGFFAVDIFFYLAGFILAYTFLKDKTKSKVKYPVAVLQRVLRLWPCYIYAMLFYYSIYLHLGSGPNWGSDQFQVQLCKDMWKQIFFVQNLVENGKQYCMGWGWYLQNDIQLFILSIGLLFIYSLKPLFSIILMFLITFGSLIFTFAWTLVHEIHIVTHFSDSFHQGTFQNDVYIKPWARAPPYIFGLFFGIIYTESFSTKILNETQKTGVKLTFLEKLSQIFKKRTKLRFGVQWFGMCLILFIILIPRTLQLDVQWPQWGHSFYLAASKLIFVMALTLAVLPSILGCKDSLVLFLMDTSFFNFIAKISFCTYLIHGTLIYRWSQNRTYTRYFVGTSQFTEFCGLLIVSLSLGFVMTLVIEIPCSKIQKKLINIFKSKVVNSSKIQQCAQIIKTQQNSLENNQINKSLLGSDYEKRL